MRFTLDTNILVYAADSGAGARHATAHEIVLRAPRLDCWLTLQSLSEFYAAVTRKHLMPTAEAAAQVEDWLMTFPHCAASATALRAALPLSAGGRVSWWDALLVATAAEAGCAAILTEDLGHGTVLGGVAVHNPFAASGGLTDAARALLAV